MKLASVRHEAMIATMKLVSSADEAYAAGDIRGVAKVGHEARKSGYLTPELETYLCALATQLGKAKAEQLRLRKVH